MSQYSEALEAGFDALNDALSEEPNERLTLYSDHGSAPVIVLRESDDELQDTTLSVEFNRSHLKGALKRGDEVGVGTSHSKAVWWFIESLTTSQGNPIAGATLVSCYDAS